MLLSRPARDTLAARLFFPPPFVLPFSFPLPSGDWLPWMQVKGMGWWSFPFDVSYSNWWLFFRLCWPQHLESDSGRSWELPTFPRGGTERSATQTRQHDKGRFWYFQIFCFTRNWGFTDWYLIGVCLAPPWMGAPIGILVSCYLMDCL